MKLNELLLALASHLRAMQLRYHEMHNLAKGESFFSDHEAFSAFYAEIETSYDAVVEWAVGARYGGVAKVDNQMNAIHNVLTLSEVEMESQLCSICEIVCESDACTVGLEQLVGTIAEQSEKRQYMLSRREME